MIDPKDNLKSAKSTSPAKGSPAKTPYENEPISARDYEFVRDLLRKEIAYDLATDKQYLVQSRLAPVAASLDLASVGELIARLRAGGDSRLREAVVEAMTINETTFFRGGPPLFDTLSAKILPALANARSRERRLRIWCAACSTGQEPYSLVMTLTDRCPALVDWRVEIVATDIAERCLARARQGTYNQFEVQRGLPIQALLKHFTKTGGDWRINEALRGRIDFRRHNLLDSFALLQPPFDLVFLRNVLIYFDASAKSALLARIHQAVAGDGYLVLGETETVLGVTDRFTTLPAQPGFFRPRGQA